MDGFGQVHHGLQARSLELSWRDVHLQHTCSWTVNGLKPLRRCMVMITSPGFDCYARGMGCAESGGTFTQYLVHPWCICLNFWWRCNIHDKRAVNLELNLLFCML